MQNAGLNSPPNPHSSFSTPLPPSKPPVGTNTNAADEASSSQRTSGIPRHIASGSANKISTVARTDARGAKKALLNNTVHQIAMEGPHRPISADHLADLQKIQSELDKIDDLRRNPAAMKYVDNICQALGIRYEDVAKDLRWETTLNQLAGTVNAAISVAPSISSFNTTTFGADAAIFAWATLAQLYQPVTGLYINEFAYYGLDSLRQTGIPGRTRLLEGAGSLKDTLQNLKGATTKLQAATAKAERLIASANSEAPEMAETGALSFDEEAAALHKQTLATVGSLDARYRRETLDSTFDRGRTRQTGVAVAKQLIIYLTQYIAFGANKNCKANDYAFYIEMGTILLGQLILLMWAAPQDRMEEGKRILSADLSFGGPIKGKDDIRAMFRSPNTQKLWQLGDSIEDRTKQQYKSLSKLCNVSVETIKKFDEAGGFNQAKFCAPMDNDAEATARGRWQELSAACEGPPIDGCRGALDELKQFVVLKDLGKLSMLQDLATMHTLNALQRYHVGKGAASGSDASLPSDDDLKAMVGLMFPGVSAEVADRRVQHLKNNPLPAGAIAKLTELKERYGLSASDADITSDQLDIDHKHIGLTLGVSEEEAGELLSLTGNGLPGKFSSMLTLLKPKYDVPHAYPAINEALKDLIDEPVDSPEAVRGVMDNDLLGRLFALQDKYVSREALKSGSFIDVSRDQMLEHADLARRFGHKLTPAELEVSNFLANKARTSTLNCDSWREPYVSASPEEDQARRDNSLTPFEHTLALVLKAQPYVVSNENGVELTQHDRANRALGPHSGDLHLAPHLLAALPEAKQEQLQTILGELRGLALDRSMFSYDFTRLTPETTRIVGNIFHGDANGLSNTTRMLTTRWNMPLYTVPQLVVSLGHASFMAVGGSSFVFFAQNAVGLIARALKHEVVCTPGMGPNEASRKFDMVYASISTLAVIFAMANAWAGPWANAASDVRKAFFRDGRPSLWQLLKAHYPRLFMKVASEPIGQKLPVVGSGVRAKRSAIEAINEAHKTLDKLRDLVRSQNPQDVARGQEGIKNLLTDGGKSTAQIDDFEEDAFDWAPSPTTIA